MNPQPQLRRWSAFSAVLGACVGVVVAEATAVFLVGPEPLRLARTVSTHGPVPVRLVGAAIVIYAWLAIVGFASLFAAPIGALFGAAIGAACGVASATAAALTSPPTAAERARRKIARAVVAAVASAATCLTLLVLLAYVEKTPWPLLVVLVTPIAAAIGGVIVSLLVPVNSRPKHLPAWVWRLAAG